MSAASTGSFSGTTLLLQPPPGAGQLDRAPSVVARRVARVAAQARLEDALRSIAVDLLGPNESDELPAACADWVAATTQAAVSDAGAVALDGLVRALDLLLVDAPPDVARRLDAARARQDAGFA